MNATLVGLERGSEEWSHVQDAFGASMESADIVGIQRWVLCAVLWL